MSLLRYICWGLVGVMLTLGGIGFDTPHFWVIILCVSVIESTYTFDER